MSQKNTGYVSEIDQFLTRYDQDHSELTATQKKEKQKHQRVYQLRDSAKRPEDTLLDDWF